MRRWCPRRCCCRRSTATEQIVGASAIARLAKTKDAFKNNQSINKHYYSLDEGHVPEPGDWYAVWLGVGSNKWVNCHVLERGRTVNGRYYLWATIKPEGQSEVEIDWADFVRNDLIREHKLSQESYFSQSGGY